MPFILGSNANKLGNAPNTPVSTWDNFKHKVAYYWWQAIKFIITFVVLFIATKIGIRIYKSAMRTYYSNEIGRLEAELQVGKFSADALRTSAPAAPPQIIYVQAPPAPK